ncbi:DUF4270 domain-containing protein [Arenibacter sp. F26102]|uniref:DUF4270 family protein n=1 Tax=Arenibacter sp. F26102 TaxID=2926416 RepID=UPI001FF4900B|nr:DUF4270 family protein [Arenibacter sp. F26102]MCK0146193.1 DUF4270 domain-containing protein [Arenibacter sp. F26102]
MKKFLGLIAVLTLMVSCSDDTINDSDFVAGGTFTNSNIRVVQIDTMNVETYTMKFDSLVTSQATRMLIGRYVDPVFGTVKSSSYAELLPYSYTIDSEAEYDSIAFFLKYDDYYYNDTLKSNTIHIKELSEILYPEDGSNFYNTSEVAYSEDDLGSITYTPRPLETDSLYIKLSDDLGQGIFEQLQQKDITNTEEFKNYFPGITFQPGEDDDGSIVGFDYSTSVMRMYYSISEENSRVQYAIDFAINTSSSPIPFFNKMSVVETNEYLTTLTDKEVVINSSDSDNQSFVQSGIGYTTKIEFSNLKTLFDIEGQGTLLNAVLKIKPVLGSYSDELALRDNLSVYIVDTNNNITNQLLGTDGAAVQATLNLDNQEFNDIYYEIPLTTYIEGILTTDRDAEYAIILLPENYNSTVDRFVLMGKEGADEGVKLELTYAIYDEDE